MKRLDDSDEYINSLQQKIKMLVNEKDALIGRNRTLEEEKELFNVCQIKPLVMTKSQLICILLPELSINRIITMTCSVPWEICKQVLIIEPRNPSAYSNFPISDHIHWWVVEILCGSRKTLPQQPVFFYFYNWT